jgi:hypothetical protein
MQPLPDAIISRFADVFASGRRGFALEEISPYFAIYGNPAPLRGAILPSKPDFFRESLLSLTPTNQRVALIDLCNQPPPTRHPGPDAGERERLKYELFRLQGLTPLSISISRLSVRGLREQWWELASRLTDSPSASITAARTLLESTCRTILSELHLPPDESGDLVRLYRQTVRGLQLDQALAGDRLRLQLAGGLVTTVSALAGLSNAAGDRHGLVAGQQIRDASVAELAALAAGTITVFLAQVYLLATQ